MRTHRCQREQGLLNTPPDSTQDCLIGMNVAPTLGFSFLDHQGKPLRTRGSQSLTNASVNLIQTQPVPARSRSFVEAEVDAELGEGVCVKFEPNPRSLKAYRLGALKSIMQVNNQRKVFVPVVNYHQRDVYIDEGTGHAGLRKSLPKWCE